MSIVIICKQLVMQIGFITNRESKRDTDVCMHVFKPKVILNIHSLHFNGHFPGEPVLAGVY